MDLSGIITRSRTTGYKSFPPADAWWEDSSFRKLTRVEAPSFILRSKKQGEVDFFLAGFRSKRVDHVGTPIRYSLFGTASSEGDIGALLSVLSSFLGDKGKLDALGEELDNQIGGDVESWMESRLDEEGAPPFLVELASFWEQHSTPFRKKGASGSLMVSIGVNNPQAQHQLNFFIDELYEKGTGCIAFLNLADQTQYAKIATPPFLAFLKGNDGVQNLKKNSLRWILALVVGVTLILLMYLILRPGGAI